MSLYSVIQQTTNVSFFSRNMIFIYTHIIYVSIYLSGHILFSHLALTKTSKLFQDNETLLDMEVHTYRRSI